MYLSKKQVNDYQKYGVIVVKDVFNNWIEPLRKGFQKVLEKPSKYGRENVTNNKGRFFEDYCNWERIEEFKDCILIHLPPKFLLKPHHLLYHKYFMITSLLKSQVLRKKLLGIKTCRIIV